MWQLVPESKMQLVSCKLPPKYLLGVSTLEGIHSIDAYIFMRLILFCTFVWFLIYFCWFYAQVFGFYMFQWTLFFEFSGFWQSVIQWSSNLHLKHVFGYWLLRSVRLFLGLRYLKVELNLLLPFTFLCWFKNFSVGCDPPQWLHFEWEIFAPYVSLT